MFGQISSGLEIDRHMIKMRDGVYLPVFHSNDDFFPIIALIVAFALISGLFYFWLKKGR